MAGEEAQQAADQGLGMTCQRALVDHAFTGHQGSVAGHRPTLLGQHQAVSGHQLTGVNPLLSPGPAHAYPYGQLDHVPQGLALLWVEGQVGSGWVEAPSGNPPLAPPCPPHITHLFGPVQ